MTSDEQRMREIEQQEQWFQEVCRDPEPLDTDRIKRRVQVTINEQWVARELGEPPTGASSEHGLAGLIDRTKRAVRAAVATEKVSRTLTGSRGGGYLNARRIIRLAGGIGLAAAACLAVYIGLPEPPADAGGPAFDRLAAFEEFQEGKLGLSLADLGDDMAELELAFNVSGLADVEDELLESLFDSVHDLILEGETDPVQIDWS